MTHLLSSWQTFTICSEAQSSHSCFWSCPSWNFHVSCNGFQHLLGSSTFLRESKFIFQVFMNFRVIIILLLNFEALMINTSENRAAQAVGNHSPLSLSWVVVTSAMTFHSCHICNDFSLFVNLKPCNIKISTTKSGESIVATGIGEIRLNTWSE